MMKYLTIIFCIALMMGCTNTAENQKHQKSIEVHEQSLSLAKKIQTSIESLETKISPSDTTQLALIDSLEVIKIDFKAWNESMVEVPGHEHEHDHDHSHHGHDHSHDHGNHGGSDLTPEMVLEIQEHIKKQAESIYNRLNAIQKNAQ